jgi:hypothetical protein
MNKDRNFLIDLFWATLATSLILIIPAYLTYSFIFWEIYLPDFNNESDMIIVRSGIVLILVFNVYAAKTIRKNRNE